MVLKVKARQKNEMVITGRVRTSFANLFEPKSVMNGPAKYSTVILIDKDDNDTLGAIKKARKHVYESERHETLLDTEYGDVSFIMHDGDKKAPRGSEEAYKGHYYMTVKSDTQPGIVYPEKGEDGKYKRITNPRDLASGDYVSVNIGLYAYNFNGNVGISAGLNHVMMLESGAKLGKRKPTAEEAFGSFDDKEEEELY